MQLECQSCGARVEIEADRRTGKCLYCGSPQVVDRPPTADRPNPELAIGFALPPEKALEVARRWVKGAFFAPQSFRKAAVEEIRGLYVPTYLYSAIAHSQYSAQIGENYTVTETYTTTDSKGRTVTRTRTKTKTEWRSLQGLHSIYVSDHVVTASRGIPNDELEAIEPFDFRDLRRFDPILLSGWGAEEPSYAPAQCVELARGEAAAQVGRMLGGFMPGDSHRSLQHSTRFDGEDLRLAMMPVWVLPVRYDPEKPPVRLLVNGQTGKITGKPPKSWVKITIAILLALAVVAGVVLLAMEASR